MLTRNRRAVVRALLAERCTVPGWRWGVVNTCRPPTARPSLPRSTGSTAAPARSSSPPRSRRRRPPRSRHESVGALLARPRPRGAPHPRTEGDPRPPRFDCWVNLAERARGTAPAAQRPHFALLRVLAPLPSPPLYVAVVLLAGVLAGAMVLVRPHPAPMALLFGLYTTVGHEHAGQLPAPLPPVARAPLSGLLPAPHRARVYGEVGGGTPGRLPLPSRPPRGPTCSWGDLLRGLFLHGDHKMDPDWREGHALMRLAQGSTAFDAVRSRYLAWGGAPSASGAPWPTGRSPCSSRSSAGLPVSHPPRRGFVGSRADSSAPRGWQRLSLHGSRANREHGDRVVQLLHDRHRARGSSPRSPSCVRQERR